MKVFSALIATVAAIWILALIDWTSPATPLSIAGLIVVCLLAFYAWYIFWMRSQGKKGLEQWPHPHGPYYERWLKLRDAVEPDYWTWLAERMDWQEPWATWAKEHAEAMQWRKQPKVGLE